MPKVKNLSNIRLIIDLYGYFSKQRRKQFKYLTGLMVIGSIFEVIGVGSIIPFIGFLVEPEKFLSAGGAAKLLAWFNIYNQQSAIIFVTIIFIVAILINGIMRIFLLWFSTKFSFGVGADLSIDMYRKTLYRPYLDHIDASSSEMIDAISTKSNNVIYSTLMPAISLLTASVLTFAIIAFLVFLNPLVAILSFAFFSSFYYLITKYTKNKLLLCSQALSTGSVEIIKSLQEGLGGIRNVIINNSQEFYCATYRNADLRLREAQGYSSFLGSSPRHIVETLAMLLLVVLSFLMAGQYGNFSAVIPILGAMAIGAQRLLPLLQIIYGAVVDIRRGQRSLESVLELLQMPLPNELSHSEKLPFFRNIEIRNLSFSYKRESRLVLNKVNLIIDKGSRVGIIGPTGGGKTTFMDVLMGLLPTPPDGGVFIDGVKLEIGNVASWRNLIAHVPQDIFLSDCSIAENIALGVDMDSIDLERVSWASEMACLGGVVADLPEGLWTEVGEKGLRLSGGQRQRIAIARALYKGGEIFIFDEATSALDSETESMVIENIEKLCEKPTIIFVAHRISTLKECQKIYRVSESKLTEISKESLGF